MTTQAARSADEKPTAIIFVDGQEFCRLYEASRMTALDFFAETKQQIPDWRELALMEWKPKYQCFIRTRLDMRG